MHILGIPSSASLFQQCVTPNPSLKNLKSMWHPQFMFKNLN